METFTDAFLPSFKRHLAYGQFYKCLAFEWDPNLGRIVQNQSSSRKICLRIWVAVSGAYIVFQAADVFLGNHPLTDKLVGGYILGYYCCCFAFRAVFDLDSSQIETLNRVLSRAGKEKHPNFIEI